MRRVGSGRSHGPVAVAVAGMLVTLAALLPPDASAQDWRGRRSRARGEIPDDVGYVEYNGRLTFARIRYTPRTLMSGWADGYPAWGHDYPRAESNFMLILREITMAHTFTEGGRIVKLGDPDLFKFPIAYLCEAGYWTMTDEEVAQVRAYVLKGGFLIFDDFGRGDWINLNEQMNRVLPGVQFIPLTLDHPIFHTFFDVRSLDLQSYRGQAQFYGVYENNDPQGRLLAVVNYNADIGEFFQYSDTGWMPVDMSNEAFKLGVNYWIYALSR